MLSTSLQKEREREGGREVEREGERGREKERELSAAHCLADKS